MADDLNRLAADLQAAPREAWPFIGKAVEVTARNVKDDWAENLGGVNNAGSSFRHVGGSVDYSITVAGANAAVSALMGGGGTGIEAEIGPNLGRRQGAFAGWFEEGQANIPALHPGQAALKANEADFERGLAMAVEDGLRKAGL